MLCHSEMCLFPLMLQMQTLELKAEKMWSSPQKVMLLTNESLGYIMASKGLIVCGWNKFFHDQGQNVCFPLLGSKDGLDNKCSKPVLYSDAVSGSCRPLDHSDCHRHVLTRISLDHSAMSFSVLCFQSSNDFPREAFPWDQS